ncbi:MAG TPA: HD domain-containing phosphohydrolase [Acidimicrobiia bacterium]|nr:HD domain-containing phosphohydrolase [Acidimicrobiia bacterium]
MAQAAVKLGVVELLASVSLATDLGTGQPMGHGLSTSLLAMSLAREMGADSTRLRHVQQVALIRFLGCTSDAADTARMAGDDELSFMAGFAPSHMGGSVETLRAMVGNVGLGHRPLRRARLVAAALAAAGADTKGLAAHCEVGAMLAGRLGLSDQVIDALRHAYERWDGKGPYGLAEDQIPIEVRIAIVARDSDLLARSGADIASVLRRRRGKAYDPDVVDVLLALSPTSREAEWSEVIEAEPDPAAHIEDMAVALAAIADFADIKSPWMRGHSHRVAELAATASDLAGLGPSRSSMLHHAGLVHDLGRVGIENGIWDRPGPLGTGEWEKVRLHPYLTQRILSRCQALADLGELASSHHERLDGSGYHRQVSDEHLPMATRILAAADVMAALTSERPHRRRFDPAEAARILAAEAESGRLDPAAVGLVTAAAGEGVEPVKPANPGGLSDREVEVLRLIARGHTNRKVADELFISAKTVGRHVENIYAKIGVSTRAGAAVYAMEHRLLG